MMCISMLSAAGTAGGVGGRQVSRRACLPVIALLGSMLFGATSARAALVYGVSLSNTLFSFDSADPTTLLSGAAISGLASNESVRGIDFRPADGQLYALGSFGRIYTLN